MKLYFLNILTSLGSCLAATTISHIWNTIQRCQTLAIAHRPHTHMIVTIQRIQIRALLRRCTDITERQRDGVLTVIVAGLAAVGGNGKIER